MDKKKILAFKWTGDQEDIQYPEWAMKAIKSEEMMVCKKNKKIWIEIKCGNLKMIAYPGNYIIKNDAGSILCMCENTFNKLYEAI